MRTFKHNETWVPEEIGQLPIPNLAEIKARFPNFSSETAKDFYRDYEQELATLDGYFDTADLEETYGEVRALAREEAGTLTDVMQEH